jgi:class I fructose-bisphosphate aldolase
VTGSVRDALRLGCTAIGFTIYPGSSSRNTMYEEIRELILEAKEHGLPTIIWAYPRGANLAKEGEQAADVTAYAAQIACQLGAHIVKVKPPKENVYQDEAKKVFDKFQIPVKTLADRVRHVVQSCFAGKRIVIFSGGEAKDDASVIEEVKQIAAGGGFGSIMGRNAFQRPRDQALKLLGDVMNVFKNA